MYYDVAVTRPSLNIPREELGNSILGGGVPKEASIVSGSLFLQKQRGDDVGSNLENY